MTSDAQFPLFAAPYAPDDEAIAAELLKGASLGDEAEARIDRLGEHLIAAARGAKTAESAASKTCFANIPCRRRRASR